MKRKNWIALLVSAVLTLSLASCAAAPAPAPGGAAAAPDAAAGTEAAAEEVSELPPVTLKIYFEGSNVTDDKPVMEAVNAYLKDKINATIEPIWGSWGDFDTNAVLALQGGEDIDIYFTSSWTADDYNKFARDGYWVRLDDPENNLIEQYAQDAWALIPEALQHAALTSGAEGFGIYGIPVYKDIATSDSYDVNLTLARKYGFDIEDFEGKAWDELGDIYEVVKQGEGPDFFPLMIEKGTSERAATKLWHLVGCGYAPVMYLNLEDESQPDPEHGLEIVDVWETPEYKHYVEVTHDYYLKGYIDPSLAAGSGDANATKQTGRYLVGPQVYAYGYEAQVSVERGIEVAMPLLHAPILDTTSSLGALYAISTASKNPERALMFLNLLNSDTKLMTMMNYGVEGMHYNLVDGLVEFTEKRSDYQPWTMGMGNVTVLTPTVEQGHGWWDEFADFYGSSKEHPSLGFIYDSSETEVILGAIANVRDEFQQGMDSGAMDPEVKLPEFIQKLKDAGVDELIEDVNRQFQEFLAEKEAAGQ